MEVAFVKLNLLLRLKLINYVLQCAETWLEQLEGVLTDPNPDERLALMELKNRIAWLQLHGVRLEKNVARGREIADGTDGQTTPMEPIH